MPAEIKCLCVWLCVIFKNRSVAVRINTQVSPEGPITHCDHRPGRRRSEVWLQLEVCWTARGLRIYEPQAPWIMLSFPG